MVSKIKNYKTQHIHTETITKAGECIVNINIQLDLNLNGSELSVSAKAEEETGGEDFKWEIPDFGGQTVKFGKQEKG